MRLEVHLLAADSQLYSPAYFAGFCGSISRASEAGTLIRNNVYPYRSWLSTFFMIASHLFLQLYLYHLDTT